MQSHREKRKGGLSIILLTFLLSFVFIPLEARSEEKKFGPSSTKETEKKEVETLLEQGKDLFQQGEYKAAISQFNKVLMVEPAHEEAKKYIIESYRELAQKEPTPDPLKVKESMINSHLKNGSSYFDRGQYDEAIEEWNQVLVLEPEHETAQALIAAGKQAKIDLFIAEGTELYQKGFYEDALAQWGKVLEIDPPNKTAQELQELGKQKIFERDKDKVITRSDLDRDKIQLDVERSYILPPGADTTGMKRVDISQKPEKEGKKAKEIEKIYEVLNTTLVSMDFEKVDLRAVMKFLSEVTGVNIIVDELVFEKLGERPETEEGFGAPEIKVTIFAKNLPLKSALTGLLRQEGLDYAIAKDFIFVSTPRTLEGFTFEKLEVRFYRLRNSARITMPKVVLKESTAAAAVGTTVDVSSAGTITERVEEDFKHKKLGEPDADRLAATPSRLVSVIRNLIPDVVDTSREEEMRGVASVRGEQVEGGFAKVSEDEDPHKLYGDKVKKEVRIDPFKRRVLSAIEFDPFTNTLCVKNTPSNLDTLERWLEHLDIEPKEVAIEAKFISVSQQDVKRLGTSLNWSRASDKWSFPSVDTAGSTVNFSNFIEFISTQGAAATNEGINVNAVYSPNDEDFLSFLITALSSLEHTRVLSVPRVTTLHQKAAVIVDTITTPFLTDISVDTTVTTGENVSVPTQDINATFTDITTGISLAVTPFVHDDNTVRLFVYPQVSSILGTQTFDITSTVPVTNPDGSVSAFPTTNTVIRPIITVQSLLTNVECKSGDTILLGGLITDFSQTVHSGVPLIMDIPFIGRLFRRDEEVKDQLNLMIFLTVNVLEPTGIAYTKLRDLDQSQITVPPLQSPPSSN